MSSASYICGASNQTGVRVQGVTSLGIPGISGGSRREFFLWRPPSEGVPATISLNEFTFGVPNTLLERETRNTYAVLDNFSVVRGTHTFKIGGIANYAQITLHSHGYNNGIFNFSREPKLATTLLTC